MLYRRDLPKRGLSGYGTFAVGAAVLIGGFYVMGLQNSHIREVKQERRRRRLAISSVLQAEEDRRYLRELLKSYEAEAVVMAGRDWEVGKSQYHSRYMLPVNIVKKNY